MQRIRFNCICRLTIRNLLNFGFRAGDPGNDG